MNETQFKVLQQRKKKKKSLTDDISLGSGPILNVDCQIFCVEKMVFSPITDKKAAHMLIKEKASHINDKCTTWIPSW